MPALSAGKFQNRLLEWNYLSSDCISTKNQYVHAVIVLVYFYYFFSINIYGLTVGKIYVDEHVTQVRVNNKY